MENVKHTSFTEFLGKELPYGFHLDVVQDHNGNYEFDYRDGEPTRKEFSAEFIKTQLDYELLIDRQHATVSWVEKDGVHLILMNVNLDGRVTAWQYDWMWPKHVEDDLGRFANWKMWIAANLAADNLNGLGSFNPWLRKRLTGIIRHWMRESIGKEAVVDLKPYKGIVTLRNGIFNVNIGSARFSTNYPCSIKDAIMRNLVAESVS